MSRETIIQSLSDDETDREEEMEAEMKSENDTRSPAKRERDSVSGSDGSGRQNSRSSSENGVNGHSETRSQPHTHRMNHSTGTHSTKNGENGTESSTATGASVDHDHNHQLSTMKQHTHKRNRSESPTTSKRAKPNPPTVTLNVGGKLFATTLQTLTSIPDTWFTACLSGEWKEHPSQEIFIDRDAQHFRYILNYLRNDRDYTNIFNALNLSTLLEIRAEANFYCLSHLRESIDKIIQRTEQYRKGLYKWREHMIMEQQSNFHSQPTPVATSSSSSSLHRTGSTPLTRPNGGFTGAHSMWRPMENSDSSELPSQAMDDFCTTADF